MYVADKFLLLLLFISNMCDDNVAECKIFFKSTYTYFIIFNSIKYSL